MNGKIQSSSASVSSPGAVLAAARAERGLTVEYVAGKLKLASFQIKAIEAGDFSVLPGAVYARGFMRNYARLLNLDAETLLFAMAQQGPSNSPSSDERLLRDVKGVALDPVRFRGLPIAAVVIAAVVGALALYEFVLDESPTAGSLKAVPTHVASAVTEGLILPVPSLGESLASRDDGQVPATDAAMAGRGLHFLFSRESWVEVRDGLGNVLFSQVNSPGTEKSVHGEPPFNIIVGSAHGVQLAYNGNPIDLAAHATEDVARLRLE